jgi:PEP-CTERM motif-containing protein
MKMAAGFRTIGLGLFVSALVASAGTIDIWSSAGTGSNNITGTNTSVLAAASWAIPVNADYEWISYGDTGCNSLGSGGSCASSPANPAATTINGTPTAIFYQTFTLSSAAAGSLDVWADDTAGVWLDSGTVDSGNGSGGTALVAPDGTLGTHCASGAIGCTPGTDAVIPLSLAAGTYTLVIDAYQLVSGTPFGVMYDGELTSVASSPTPEPASYMLMGLGLVLVSLGAFKRRRAACAPRPLETTIR